MAAIVRVIVRLFVDSQRLIARSQNRTKCVKYVWLSYHTWPSRWVLCISMQWLRLKGCHVACDEWRSGEICSLQHMWVNRLCHVGSREWRVTKFGVQCATATNWFPRVNGARDNGIWLYLLTHWGQAMHLYVSKLGHHCFREWLVTCLVPSHHLKQCWNIVNWNPRNKLQWNPNRNSYIFIQENAFENGIYEMAFTLSWPQFVNSLAPGKCSRNITRVISGHMSQI